MKALEHTGDFIRNPLAFGIRKVPGDREFRRGRQMILEHVALYASYGGYNSARLVDDLQAMATVLDHLLKAPNLSLDAPQTRKLPRVVGRLYGRLCGSFLARCHDR